MNAPRMVEHAIFYARMGWYVFPCAPGQKTPLVKWRSESTNQTSKIIADWRRWPDANIACDCGKSGLYVIDCDGPTGTKNWEIIADAGDLYRLVSQVTGSGEGMQLFFTNPNHYPNSTGAIMPSIDTRGEGGYVILPPSLHPSGLRYAWMLPPGSVPLFPVPESIVPPKPSNAPDQSRPKKPLPTMAPARDNSGARWIEQAVQRARPGTRNAEGFRLACMLRDDGHPMETAAQALARYQQAVSRRGDHPYEWYEAEASLQSAYSHPAREPARR